MPFVLSIVKISKPLLLSSNVWPLLLNFFLESVFAIFPERKPETCICQHKPTNLILTFQICRNVGFIWIKQLLWAESLNVFAQQEVTAWQNDKSHAIQQTPHVQ